MRAVYLGYLNVGRLSTNLFDTVPGAGKPDAVPSYLYSVSLCGECHDGNMTTLLVRRSHGVERENLRYVDSHVQHPVLVLRKKPAEQGHLQ